MKKQSITFSVTYGLHCINLHLVVISFLQGCGSSAWHDGWYCRATGCCEGDFRSYFKPRCFWSWCWWGKFRAMSKSSVFERSDTVWIPCGRWELTPASVSGWTGTWIRRIRARAAWPGTARCRTFSRWITKCSYHWTC